MHQRYGGGGCPAEYPVRTKCVALFQEIHGVDTMLFALYVHEYGQECPAPNRRRVYLSYLDSVQYFEPKCYRTIAYHAVLVEYLRYVKSRGFHTAHIWSCPPTPGDDYIFYCHPAHQLTPREDMLRAWYHRMLDKAKVEGVVLRTTTLYDEYFVKDGVDSVSWSTGKPTCLPYFEGDYIPGEIENIIRLENERRLRTVNDTIPDTVMARLAHNLGKMKDNFIVAHLRSRRFVSAVEHGEDVSQWKDSGDEVMRNKRAKITGKDSSILHQTKEEKESDISDRVAGSSGESLSSKIGGEATIPVKAEMNDAPATLASTEENQALVVQSADKAEAGQGGAVVQKAPEDNKAVSTGDQVDSGDKVNAIGADACEPKESEKTDSTVTNATTSNAGEVESCTNLDSEGGGQGRTSTGDEVVKTTKSMTKDCDIDRVNSASTVAKPERSSNENEGSASLNSDDILSVSLTSGEKEKPTESGTDRMDTTDHSAATQIMSSKADVVTSTTSQPDEAIKQQGSGLSSPSKRSFEEIAPALSPHFGDAVKYVANTSDEDDPVETELFESRQRFLNYCQATHCQFDELRRAKHSTMMVLFQLHNPAAPLFLRQCGSCYRDITHGTRFHCNDCSNFDLCQECYEPVTSGRWAERDPRFGHDKAHMFTPIDMEASTQTGSSREERQESLKAHVALLEHVGTCLGAPGCSLQNCQRMKKLLDHVSSCEVKPKSECRICTRLLSLCAIHSRKCTVGGSCPVPFCDRIREQNKRLRQQQRLMDDRRRRAQNDLYHATES